MLKNKILWIDDEVDLLKPHIIFLEKKGYITQPCTNGNDAIDLIVKNKYDLILLDENMPGLSGIETLKKIKKIQNNLPVVMVTKNEEEYLMEEAIGSKIADYIIKPVKPMQIVMTLKKILQHSDIIQNMTLNNYQNEFLKISNELSNLKSFSDWKSFYKKLVYWELELENSSDINMIDIFDNQLKEANSMFSKFISKNYKKWFQNIEEAPILSNSLFKEKIFPHIGKNTPVLLLIIDNLRLDQWKSIQNYITPIYNDYEESEYFSILPTTTQYARNSIFSGMTPLEISQFLPEYWINDNEIGGKNNFEEELLKIQLKKLDFSEKFSYHKITNIKSGKNLISSFNNYKDEALICVVYNFVDMISHAKSEMEIIKELASNNKAYRSLTKSWFSNSPLFELIKKSRSYNQKLIITSDHGTINVNNSIEIIGDRESSINLRYKTGKSLKFPSKKVFEVNSPEEIGLPKLGINHNYIFARDLNYFIYPKNYNYYSNLFKNSFQHGGISMEEMIVPFIILNP